MRWRRAKRPRRPWRSRLKRVGLALLVGTLALEIAARFVLGNVGELALLDFEPEDGRTLALEPGKVSRYDGYFLKVPEVTLEVNELGFRGPPRPRGKAFGRYRVALLGDSYTYGVGVEEDETTAHQLEPLLRGPDSEVEVLNFGIPGANSADLVTQHPRFVSRWYPDLLVLQVSPNDLDRPMFQPDDPVDPDVVAAIFGNSYAARVGLVAAFLAVRGVLSPLQGEPVDAGPAIAAGLDQLRGWLAATRESTQRRRTELAIVLLGNPVPGARLEDVLAIAREHSSTEPLDVSFLLADARYTIPNEGHLNPDGHARLAEELAALVARVRAPRTGDHGATSKRIR